MKLVGGDFAIRPCSACKGRGSVKHEDWQRRDGKWVRGGGRIPCAACKGTKIEAAPTSGDERPIPS